MAGVNKIILLGNVGQDPISPPGAPGLVTFSVATSLNWIDKQTSEKKTTTEWHNINCNGKVADIVSKYVKKGSKIYIEGRLKYGKYTDKNGNEVKTSHIQCHGVQLLDSKQESDHNTDSLAHVQTKQDFDDDIGF